MDLFKLLKKDHERIRSLLTRIQELPPEKSERRKALLDELHETARFHFQTEETFFYPRIRDCEELRSQALSALDQHRESKNVLRRISGSPSPSLQSVRKLHQLLNLHLDEEEDLFEEAAEVIDEQVLREMARAVSEIKRERLAAN